MKEFSIYLLNTKNSNDLKTWTLIETINVFSGRVIVMDWSKDNKLLVASFDNNALVLEQDESKGKWTKHIIVMNKQYRSLMCGSWSNDGKKFILGGGNKNLYIGEWNDEFKNYDTKSLDKSLKSCILSSEFHPKSSDTIVLTGISNQLVLIQSINGSFQFDTRTTIGSWGNYVTWSPSGNGFTVLSQANKIHSYTFIQDNIEDSRISNFKYLPLTILVYLNDNEMIAGGFDGIPFRFKLEDGKWILKGYYSEFVGGHKIQLKKTLVESLSSDQDMKIVASKREFGNGLTKHHMTKIDYILFEKEVGSEYFYTGDSKGNLICWEIKKFTKL